MCICGTVLLEIGWLPLQSRWLFPQQMKVFSKVADARLWHNFTANQDASFTKQIAFSEETESFFETEIESRGTPLLFVCTYLSMNKNKKLLELSCSIPEFQKSVLKLR